MVLNGLPNLKSTVQGFLIVLISQATKQGHIEPQTAHLIRFSHSDAYGTILRVDLVLNHIIASRQ